MRAAKPQKQLPCGFLRPPKGKRWNLSCVKAVFPTFPETLFAFFIPTIRWFFLPMKIRFFPYGNPCLIPFPPHLPPPPLATAFKKAF